MDSIDKINAILAKRGITGADLGRMIGVTNGVYSQWNTKRSKPSNPSLRRIADALEIDVRDILPDSVVETPAQKTEGGLSVEQREIMELYDVLDPPERNLLLETARALARGRKSQDDR